MHAVQTVVQTCNVTTVVGTGAALDKNDLVRARASWQWSRKFDAGRRERRRTFGKLATYIGNRIGDCGGEREGWGGWEID